MSKKFVDFKSFIFVLVILLLAPLTSCNKKNSRGLNDDSSKQKSFVFIAKDYYDRDVVMSNAAASKVVVMADNALPIVRQVGAIGNVIALDSNTKTNLSISILSKTNPKLLELPDVGKTSNSNYELITSLNPDLIIFNGSKEDADILAKKTDTPVACFLTRDGYDFKAYMFIATLFGRQERAKSVVKVLEKYKNLLEVELSNVNKRKIAYFVVQNQKKLLTQSAKNIISSQLANLVNIADSKQSAEQYGFVKIPEQSLIDSQLDLVFIDLPLNSNGIQKDDVINSDIFKSTSAVKDGKVYYTHSLSLSKDYVYVIAEAYYYAMLAYPEVIDEGVCRECINECFKIAYSIPDYYDEFKNDLK